jgi:hypothetical protein
MIKARDTTRLLVILSIAIVITLATFAIQRHGPEVGTYGNVCGSTGDQPCTHILLNAGYPLGYVFDMGYVFDNPSVSVRDKLMPIIEDEFRIIPFILDTIFYAVALSLLSIGFKKIRPSEGKKYLKIQSR